MSDRREPLHRDDVPADVAEAIVEELKRLHPGATVQFAGDVNLSPGQHEATNALLHELEGLFVNGQCMDCKKKMPNWPETPDGMDDEWQPATGWKHFNDMRGEIVGWQCPECDAAESVDASPAPGDTPKDAKD